MTLRGRIVAAVLLIASAYSVTLAQTADLNPLYRIKQEAFQNSQVMDHLFYLTDVYGPRLTGSPGYRQAADWAVKRYHDFGIEKTALERWEGIERGWSCTNFEAHLEKPRYAPLIGFALPWSPGTSGAVHGTPVLAPITTEADFEKFKGKLKGSIVLLDAPRPSGLQTTLPPQRFTELALQDETQIPDPISPGFFTPRSPERRKGREVMRAFRNRLHQFLRDEGVRLVVRESTGGGYGNVHGTGAGAGNPGDVAPPPTIVLALDHYNRVARLIQKQAPVEMAADVRVRFEDQSGAFNVISEIPGGARRAEVVMLGAHLDSWTGGTGATDDAAGCAVVMETMRILKALGLKMDRTVRAGLWGGEEQGILGSQAYVKAHFGDRETMRLRPEQARVSVYFNYDYGAGKIRGVYLQNNDAARPVFESWFEPLSDLGVTAVSIRNGGGTDHLAFDAIGIPAFQFIQDPLEYGWRTHHTSMDVYERVPASDAMQSAAVLAWLVYNAANRPELMPRKPVRHQEVNR